jgi:hypothetical protein
MYFLLLLLLSSSSSSSSRTPRSTVVLEKLTFPQLIKAISIFMESVGTAYYRIHKSSPLDPNPEPDESSPYHPGLIKHNTMKTEGGLEVYLSHF